MRRIAQVYIGVLGVLAAGILVEAGLHLNRAEWPALLVLAVAGVAANLYTYRSEGAHRMSFLGPTAVVAVLTAGPGVAVLAVALAELIKALVRRVPGIPALYNISQYVITTWVTAAVFGLLGGRPGLPFTEPVRGLLAAVAFMVVNWALLSLLLHLLNGQGFLAIFVQHLISASTYTYFIGQTLAVVAAGALGQSALWLLPLASLASLLYGAFHHHFSALNEARSKGEQLAAVLDATRSAMVAVDGSGRILIANRRFGELFRIGDGHLAGTLLAEALPPEVGALAGAPPEVAGQSRVIEWNGLHLDWFHAPVGSDGAAVLHVFTDVTAAREQEVHLRRAHDAVIQALTAAIDARDPYTRGHSQRVAEIAAALAVELGLPEADVRRVRYAALLHDVGKVGIDDQVLRKDGPLTPGERAMMMQHPVIGAEMLKKAEILRDLLPGIRWHHEWLNGGGYPDGLAGEEIPLDARLIGVADAFDAMTSDRPYRQALTGEEALRRLQSGEGEQFDPAIVAALVRLFRSGRVAACGDAAAAGGRSPAAPDAGLGQIRPVHGKELRVLYQLAREEVDHRDLGGTLQRYFELFAEHVGDFTYVAFICRPDRPPVVASAHGQTTAQGELAGIAARVGRVRETQITHLNGADGACFVLALPLVARGELVGVLCVQAAERGAFHDETVYLLEALSHPVASAISLALYHDRLAHAATHDALTGLLNRAAFYERLTATIGQTDRPVALAILDLDGFKELNDTFGHLTGDTLLSRFGSALAAACRPEDAVARLGGDEFAILMPDADRETAVGLAARARDLLAGLTVPGVESWAMPGVSIGVAVYPEDALTANDLAILADQAMYRNKASRRRGLGVHRLVSLGSGG